MTFADQWEKQRDEDQSIQDQWQLGDYVSISCPNCSRERVCLCPNGKHRCEKCNWIVEDNMYCEIRF